MISKLNTKPKSDRALPAAKWVPILDAAGLSPQTLTDAKTPHARAIKLGQWLSAKIGREVSVCSGGRNGKAVLRMISARANEKRYYFEITWQQPRQPELPPIPKGETSKPKKSKKQKEKHKTVTNSAGNNKHTASGNNEEW